MAKKNVKEKSIVSVTAVCGTDEEITVSVVKNHDVDLHVLDAGMSVDVEADLDSPEMVIVRKRKKA